MLIKKKVKTKNVVVEREKYPITNFVFPAVNLKE